MTISTVTYKKTYTGDGADVTFDFDFQVEDESHLTVQLVNSSGTVQTQTISSDYTVSGTGNTDGSTDYTSGTVTFLTAPASTDTIIIKRSTPLTQSVDYVENDNFPAETHEGALDKITLMVQDQQEQLDRCFKRDYIGDDTADFTLPAPVADYYLRFNSAADGLEAVANTGTIGLDNVVEDPSPQLGGNLDVNGNTITSASNGNIVVDPNGTGEIRLDAATITVEDDIAHKGDTNNKITFGTDTQDLQTGGSSRLDISDSGVRLGGANSRVTTILNETTMSSASATALTTQAAVKTYIDTNAVLKASGTLDADLDLNGNDLVTTDTNKDIGINPHGSGDVNITTDTGGNVNIASANDIDLQSDSILVGQDIKHKGDTDNKVVFGTDTQDFQTGASSRLDISNSGVRLGATGARVTDFVDEDTMSSNSATKVPTQQSVKAYVDNKSASQSDMETGTSTTVYTSPGVQQYHESAAKFWCLIDNGGGTYSIDAEYNVDSLTDQGTSGGKSIIDINIDTDFSSANYAASVTSEEAVGTGGNIDPIRSRAAGVLKLLLTDLYEYTHVIGFGDQ